MFKTITSIVDKYKYTTFQWGDWDSCIFVVSLLEEYNKTSFPKWREVIGYKNLKEAVSALRKLGCDKLEDLPGIILETPRKDIKDVKHGDVVYFVNEDGVGILGVCNGVRAYFLQKGGGLTARSVLSCKYAWSVN